MLPPRVLRNLHRARPLLLQRVSAGGLSTTKPRTEMIRDGTDIPADDPPTTFRASMADILDLHLHPRHEDAAEALQRRYRVPVAVYEADEWPTAIAPLEAAAPAKDVDAFCAAVAQLGRFGTQSTADAGAFVGTGRWVVDGIRIGLSTEDAARLLFETNARPTWAQAVAFTDAAVRHLAPDLTTAPSYPLVLPPVRLIDKMVRAALVPGPEVPR